MTDRPEPETDTAAPTQEGKPHRHHGEKSHRHEETPPEQASLAELVSRVSRRLRRMSQDSLSSLDISPANSRALWVIAHHGGMRPSDLSEHLRVSPRYVTEVVDVLEARGLVARSPDPDDRRATLVTLTGRGEDLLAEVRRARGTEAAAAFGLLSDWERATLHRILVKLAAD